MVFALAPGGRDDPSMKANQAFRNADEAVSPVIGVILMVAITVVLGAVVFLLATNLSKGPEDKPQVGFYKDERGSVAGGSLTVATITNGPIAWANIQLGGTATGCYYDTTTAASTTVLPSGNMAAGDQITCSVPGTITISDSATDTLLYSGAFT